MTGFAGDNDRVLSQREIDHGRREVGEPDSRVEGLARVVERTSRRVKDLDGLLRELAEDVASLAARAADVSPAEDGQASPPLSWLLVDDPDLAVAAMQDLVEWLARVYLRYGGDAELPACWLWHPGVVEELMWLRRAHAAAFSGKGPTEQRIGDWHDRQRPNVVKRLHDELKTCHLGLHAEGKAPVSREVPFAGIADLHAEQWATSKTTPQPSPEQVTQADQYDQALHQ
jgi:hypothetical protein